MVTSIERNIGTLKYYDNLEEYSDILKNIYFAGATIIRNEVFSKCVDEYKMRCVTINRDFNHYDWTQVNRGKVSSGKSCANLAFNILTMMGFDKIYLVGQDLAFGENDVTHVEGADHSIDGMKKSPRINEIVYVEGNYHDKVKTIKTWKSFKDYYEKDISLYNGIVYNCTEGDFSAKIFGAEVSTLDAHESYLTTETFNNESIYKFTCLPQGVVNRDMKKYASVLKNTPEHLKKIIKCISVN
jgi:hypothetical protein